MLDQTQGLSSTVSPFFAVELTASAAVCSPAASLDAPLEGAIAAATSKLGAQNGDSDEEEIFRRLHLLQQQSGEPAEAPSGGSGGASCAEEISAGSTSDGDVVCDGPAAEVVGAAAGTIEGNH